MFPWMRESKSNLKILESVTIICMQMVICGKLRARLPCNAHNICARVNCWTWRKCPMYFRTTFDFTHPPNYISLTTPLELSPYSSVYIFEDLTLKSHCASEERSTTNHGQNMQPQMSKRDLGKSRGLEFNSQASSSKELTPVFFSVASSSILQYKQ